MTDDAIEVDDPSEVEHTVHSLVAIRRANDNAFLTDARHHRWTPEIARARLFMPDDREKLQTALERLNETIYVVELEISVPTLTPMSGVER